MNKYLSDTLYQQMALPLEQITRAVKLMLALTLLAGTVIVSLLLCMWMRTRQKETAIFISVGKSKASIFLQVFMESFFVFAFAVFLFNICNKLVSPYDLLLYFFRGKPGIEISFGICHVPFGLI